MKILVVGMGLIGGSICKALKKYTDNEVYGSNRSESKLKLALADGAIDGVGNIAEEDYDIIWMCMYKEALEKLIRENAPKLKKGTIIADVCGLKGKMTENMSDCCEQFGVHYVGTHPMAGKEKNGYAYSDADMFKNCNFILSPTDSTNSEAMETIKNLALAMGAGNIVYSSPEEHDRMIAYTSHIPHIIAGSYVSNELVEKANDFGGGSFRDVSRVATMDAGMWSELFLDNKDAVLEQIAIFKKNIEEYESAIRTENKIALEAIIGKSRLSKEIQIKSKS
mgnify:FL=1